MVQLRGNPLRVCLQNCHEFSYAIEEEACMRIPLEPPRSPNDRINYEYRREAVE